MSNHACEVVPVTLLPHPNADSLSIVQVKGWTVVVKTAEWQGKTQGIYIPPDSIVPDLPEWSWLENKRIRARKYRGVVSFGMLTPAPDGAQIGDDYADVLGILHYEPPLGLSTEGEVAPSPPGYYPRYDVENLYNYPHIFVEGEPVIATEKLHGTSFRAVWLDGMHVGSRNEWKRQHEKSIYWKVLELYPIEAFCKQNPGITVYGEVFGPGVQGLHYGAPGLQFACFDLWDRCMWLSYDRVQAMLEGQIPTPPLVYRGPFSLDKLRTLSEQDSTWPGAKHLREGIVIKAVPERMDIEIGRAQLKLVSARYLCKEQ